ncbi:DMT family transporter [Corynebacterium kutscheri]|nr:DMT family transporter [Corynebacterium kutscheri]
MSSNVLAVFFALASALTIAWGTVVRHRVATEASEHVFFSAIRRPRWWIGMSTALIGYGLQVVALGFGTLLIVQPILVLSLMFTLPLSARYDGRKLASDEMTWASLLTIAVAILVILGKPLPGKPQPELSEWRTAVVIGAVILIGMWLWAKRTANLNQRALLLGSVTGGIYGFVAVLSKATVDVFTHAGGWGLLTSWQLYSLIALASLGAFVQQYAFNAGRLKNSLPAMTIVEPIVAFALGYAILGEKFQVSGWNWTLMALALIVMILSTIALSSRRVG